MEPADIREISGAKMKINKHETTGLWECLVSGVWVLEVGVGGSQAAGLMGDKIIKVGLEPAIR